MTGRGWSVETWRAWCATHVTSHPGQTHMLGPVEGLVQRLTADTRTLHRPSDTVFFALHGPWHDGHDFLVEAHRAGVRRFVVRRSPSDSDSWAQDADVLVVEDIVDTGHTLHHVTNLLRSREPARLKSIALLDKPTRREVDLKADWTGFEIPDEFVVGYGIDYAQRNRNLPFIGKVRFPEA